MSSVLSPIQQGMVFHHLMDGQSGVDVEQIIIELEAGVDVPLLMDAWQSIYSTFAELRCSVREDNGAYLIERSVEDPLPIERCSWSARDSGELEAFLESDRRRGFDLFEGPLMRLTVATLPTNEVICIWTLHHILCDGRSFPTVLRAVFDVYDARSTGSVSRPEPAPDVSPHYEWLARQTWEEGDDYWRQQFEGITHANQFPGERTDSKLAGGERRELRVHFDAEETRSLDQAARKMGGRLGNLLQAAWGIVVGAACGDRTAVFGTVRSGRYAVPDAAAMIGVFINTLPVRVDTACPSAGELVRNLRAQQVATRNLEHTPLTHIQKLVGSSEPLFSTLLMFDTEVLDYSVKKGRAGWERRHFLLREKTPYPLTLYAYAEPSLEFRLVYDPGVHSDKGAERLLEQTLLVLRAIAEDPSIPPAEVPLLSARERALLDEWNRTAGPLPSGSIVDAFNRAAERSPDAIALIGDDRQLSYREVDDLSARIAGSLQRRRVPAGACVGLCAPRSVEMVLAVLGILKAGAHYLPLDPGYPKDRLRFCAEDSGTGFILCAGGTARIFEGIASVATIDILECLQSPTANAAPACPPDELAYLIYTSGSTGLPKGVRVRQSNVINFFNGMDQVIVAGEQRVWVAVTSLSFDISVLELLWTLTRSFTVVLHGASQLSAAPSDQTEFSLFYFSSDNPNRGEDPYRLVLEGARFADKHGLHAIWTPERHFHQFGALYPNPSVISAAIAAVTERVLIRAGSVVLPLHDPVRVTEEWALVDNLSHGRVGLAFASGWQPNDFILKPENYADRQSKLVEGIDTVRTLWSGGAIEATNPRGDRVEIRTYPRPVQQQLPVWITTAGSEASFVNAARQGANILTHLLGQTVPELEHKIRLYQQARAECGHPPGRITVMLHTFIGDVDLEVRELVRQPMTSYLRSSASLVGNYADAWTAYRQSSGNTSIDSSDLTSLSEEEFDSLLEFAFERYYSSSSLLGTVEKCADISRSLIEAGVTEIACLVDFGVETELVLSHLPYINRLRELVNVVRQTSDRTLVEDIRDHAATHLQCTPSQARTLGMQLTEGTEIDSLQQLLVGGEALPADMLGSLRKLLPGCEIVNMYGPTETTVWSTCKRFSATDEHVTIGRPLLNTTCHVLDATRRPVPIGMPGELYIGGEGVTAGYHRRDALNRERFVHVDGLSGPLYATGDIVRFLDNGELEYLGRSDFQVKIRGHRIELGEIEEQLRRHPDIDDAVATAKSSAAGDVQLRAYYRSRVGTMEPASLRAFLRRSLPDYMLPQVFIAIKEMPLTPNGKVDRNALPDPETVRVPERREAESDLERSIADVWGRVLNIDTVSVNANFFDLGGHSLLAVKLQSELAELLGTRFPIAQLFRYPTIESFAQSLKGAQTAVDEQGIERGRRRRRAMSRRQGRSREQSGHRK